ncbi:hypothetical protein [Nostoc sp. UHCC 0252]|nr:hypothetical protein [Nostoc sp. UHCC 0252]MEA5603226.1 hypothetical protein [Nostoc sp. UHCC 0252]
MVIVISNSTDLPSGSLKIDYIASLYRQQGYASEATKAVVDWALSQPDV